MRSDSTWNEPRMDADQDETPVEFRSTYEPRRGKAREKFVLASKDDSCWRLNTKLWEGATDGPYVVMADKEKRGGGWIVWSGAGVAARFGTEAEARAKMAELAERWRDTSTRKVYFIGVECKLGAAVKIGIAYEPKKRLASLQTSWPFELRILAQHEGGPKEERRYHEKFHRCRLRGEWFRITPALKRLIERHGSNE